MDACGLSVRRRLCDQTCDVGAMETWGSHQSDGNVGVPREKGRGLQGSHCLKVLNCVFITSDFLGIPLLPRFAACCSGHQAELAWLFLIYTRKQQRDADICSSGLQQHIQTWQRPGSP